MLIDDDLPVAIPIGEEAWTARALSLAPNGRVDIAGIEMADGLTIATHRKIGWRYWPDGGVMSMDIDLADTARQAVFHVVADEPPGASSTEERAAGRWLLDETTRLGALVHDRSVWPARPIFIDDTEFALFTITTSNGQAAVADLGPVRLALYGPAIPQSLALQLTPLRKLTLEPVLWGDAED